MAREGMLTVKDLWDRGWTSGMIKKLMPDHDCMEKNPKNGTWSVRLYQEERVQELECGGAFAELLERSIQAQERTAKARATRERQILKGIDEHAAAFSQQNLSKILSPAEVEKQAGIVGDDLHTTIWMHHALDVLRHRARHKIGRLDFQQQYLLEKKVLDRAREVLREVYPWAYTPQGDT